MRFIYQFWWLYWSLFKLFMHTCMYFFLCSAWKGLRNVCRTSVATLVSNWCLETRLKVDARTDKASLHSIRIIVPVPFIGCIIMCELCCASIKLMKGKAPRKHSLHEKTAASVLLKMFFSGNEWCHTTDAP